MSPQLIFLVYFHYLCIAHRGEALFYTMFTAIYLTRKGKRGIIVGVKISLNVKICIKKPKKENVAQLTIN